MTNFLIEIFGTLIYMFVLFPMFLVLNLCFMILEVLLLPLKIPAVKGKLANFVKRDKKRWYHL